MKHIAEIFQIGHAAFLRRVFTSVLLGVTVGLTPTLAFARDVSVPHSLAPDSPTAPLTLVALGNRVWLDINNDGTVSDGENGIPDVVLSLYRDSNASGVFDVGDTFVASQGTGPGGYYAFRDLEQSHTATNRYIVVVEGSNFCVGGALHELASSTGAVAGDSDLNNRDHGIDPATANCGVSVSGTAVTLLYGQEPIDDGDSANDTNMTIDFGFHKPLHTATATATTTPTPTSTKTATPTSTGTATDCDCDCDEYPNQHVNTDLDADADVDVDVDTDSDPHTDIDADNGCNGYCDSNRHTSSGRNPTAFSIADDNAAKRQFAYANIHAIQHSHCGAAIVGWAWELCLG